MKGDQVMKKLKVVSLPKPQKTVHKETTSSARPLKIQVRTTTNKIQTTAHHKTRLISGKPKIATSQGSVKKTKPPEQFVLKLLEREVIQKSANPEECKSDIKSRISEGIYEDYVYVKDGIKYQRKMFNNVPYYHCIKCPVRFQTWGAFKIHSTICGTVLPQQKWSPAICVSKDIRTGKPIIALPKKPNVVSSSNKQNKKKQGQEEASDPERIHMKEGLFYQRKMANGLPFYHCLQCPLKFRTWDPFKRHSVKKHEANIELDKTNRLACLVCSKTFGRKDALNMHFNAAHSKEKSYTCEYCGFGTRYRTSLWGHIRKVHTDPGAHPCVIPGCSKKFADRKSLERHLTVHTGERKFKCNDCEKSFKSRSNLNQHSLTHKPEGKYKCPRCLRTFNYNQNFKIHVSKCCGMAGQ